MFFVVFIFFGQNLLETFLYSYIAKDILIKCYVIDRFFVEVINDDEHNKITEVRSFKAGGWFR